MNTFGEAELRTTEEQTARLTAGWRKWSLVVIGMIVIGIALYVGLPRLVGAQASLRVVRRAEPAWLALAFAFAVLSFAAYIMLFKNVVGQGPARGHVSGPRARLGWSASYKITMASLAATTLFTAGGAGGIALMYWAIRQAGLDRREAARRLVAFLVLVYAIYMSALVVCGLLLRTGVLPGPAPLGMTIVPAVFGAIVISLILALALVPADLERRAVARLPLGRRHEHLARVLAIGPEILGQGTRLAMSTARPPRGVFAALMPAAAYWAGQIAVLWACFHAFGGSVSLAVLVQAFFVGMLANLLPFFPGGVGSVDAGLIASFLAFGESGALSIVAVLSYRAVSFWIPTVFEVTAYFQLRRVVQRWRDRPALDMVAPR